LEDPVEYFLKGVNQSQINPDVGLTFASGLRSILRQDPDIILVGEIRDNETADLAIHAALTGHLMLSTLHTNDAFGAIPRFVDLKIEPFLLASTLNVVIAQRLVRKLCQDCKEKVDIPEKLKNELKEELGKVNPEFLPKGIDLSKELTFWHGKGCKRCGGTGYKGRSAVSEVLPVTDDIKEMINEKAQWHKIRDVFGVLGILTLKQDGMVKALKGVTTIEEVLRVTKE
jgi:type II secretory ATPase GspE/PulE/Tfp pilus assembly ATPase PilB-like protein